MEIDDIRNVSIIKPDTQFRALCYFRIHRTVCVKNVNLTDAECPAAKVSKKLKKGNRNFQFVKLVNQVRKQFKNFPDINKKRTNLLRIVKSTMDVIKPPEQFMYGGVFGLKLNCSGVSRRKF